MTKSGVSPGTQLITMKESSMVWTASAVIEISYLAWVSNEGECKPQRTHKEVQIPAL